MQFDEYQTEAMKTDKYPRVEGVAGPLPVYPSLAMCGEAGEAAEKVKKAWRDGHALDVKAYVRELGDVLWYITAAARDVGSSLEEVAQESLEKLRDRRARGVLGGSGDNR